MKIEQRQGVKFEEGPAKDITDAEWEASHDPSQNTPAEIASMKEAEDAHKAEQEAEYDAAHAKAVRVNNMRIAREETMQKLVKQPWHKHQGTKRIFNIEG